MLAEIFKDCIVNNHATVELKYKQSKPSAGADLFNAVPKVVQLLTDGQWKYLWETIQCVR